MISLILCGGAGTRLWPISRQLMPKQFYPLFDQGSLFEAVVRRNLPLIQRFAVAANKEQAFLAFDQLAAHGITERRGLIEPVGRNTAPAIALIAMSIDPEETILVSPSDHLIIEEEAYRKAIKRAQELAEDGRIVTFGIKPTYPETGYGYIEHDGERVVAFREKPDKSTAADYIKNGYLWNSGMFCFKAGTFLDELAKWAPSVYDACKSVYTKATSDGGGELVEPSREEMETIPPISVDYAVMERSNLVSVVLCDIGWSDLGSFDSLYPIAYNSEVENAVLSEETPMFIDSKENLVISRGKKKVVLIEIEQTSVIDTEDALLVVKRGAGQRVKEAVDELKSESSPLLQAHVKVRRPWGSYTILHESDRVKVKQLKILPGRRISLQKHERRQEHWVCVDGVGKVILNNDELVLTRTKEVHIQAGDVHRLECLGEEPLVIIETQIGDYFGEDDIIRLEDDFRRT